MQAGNSTHRETSVFARVVARTRYGVPLALGRASAGFPSPAEDYLDRPLDFNELLIGNPDDICGPPGRRQHDWRRDISRRHRSCGPHKRPATGASCWRCLTANSP